MTERLRRLAAVIFVFVGSTVAPAMQAPAREATETDQLVKAVLERSFRSGRFPDIGLLPRGSSVPIVTDVDGLVSDRALPQLADWAFELRSRADLEAAATKAGGNIFYASVARVRIEGQTATQWVGVSFVEPSDRSPVPRLCCCGAQLEYRKIDGNWAYSKTLSMICA